MKITSISSQVRNPDRVNISVDGKYRFSLDIFQVVETGIKIGLEVDENRIEQLEQESQFGKMYGQSLEYCLVRPRSVREMRDYLYRKTRDRKVRSRKDGQIIDRKGISVEITEKVLDRLINRGYVDDEKFAKYWVENRYLRKGSSLRRLAMELMNKGVDQGIIKSIIEDSDRNDSEELKKIISKKRQKYDDKKLIQYLVRQGFSYDDVKSSLSEEG